MEYHPHARVATLLFHQFAAVLRALVVDHIDALDLGRNTGDHVQDVGADFVGRDGDGDAVHVSLAPR